MHKRWRWIATWTGLALGWLGCSAEAEPAPDNSPFSVVSWNVGTVGGPGTDPAEYGFGKDERTWSDSLYGNGLAFLPAVEDVRRWLWPQKPDIVALQEVFDPEACADIPQEARVGFICASWQPGDTTVAQRVVPAGYTVACHPGKPDKCIAVRDGFARIDGCSGPLCRDAGTGFSIPGCGKGARAAHFVLRRPGGKVLHVRHIHGNSGLATSDKDCRKALFQLALSDLEPGPHLVLGDFNTDPVRFAGIDPSADALAALTGPGQPLQFLTETAESSEPTYGGIVSIDHVLAVGLQGSCVHPGISPGWPAATEVGWFDHRPAVSVAQRFSSDLKFNLHWHILLADGVWQERGGQVQCYPAEPLDTIRVQQCWPAHLWCDLLHDAVLRITKALTKRGWQDREDDPFAEKEPGLASSHQRCAVNTERAALPGKPIDPAAEQPTRADLNKLPKPDGRNSCARRTSGATCWLAHLRCDVLAGAPSVRQSGPGYARGPLPAGQVPVPSVSFSAAGPGPTRRALRADAQDSVARWHPCVAPKVRNRHSTEGAQNTFA